MNVDEHDKPARPGDGRDRVTRSLRWLLVLPAGLLGWQLGQAAGVALQGVAAWLCSLAQTGSGACAASWWPLAEGMALHAGAAAAAVLAVLAPVLTAPTMRGTVAWTAYGLAAAVAGHLAWMNDAWTEMLVVVAAGFAVLLATRRRWRSAGRPRRVGEEQQP